LLLVWLSRKLKLVSKSEPMTLFSRRWPASAYSDLDSARVSFNVQDEVIRK
jgi:hypothetical protein